MHGDSNESENRPFAERKATMPEIQRDEIDSAMESHRRSDPPEELLDRCLATIPTDSRLAEPQSVTPANSEARSVRSYRLIPWAVAASLAIGAGGAFIMYSSRKEADRHWAFLASNQSASEMQSRMDSLNQEVQTLTGDLDSQLLKSKELSEANAKQIVDQQRNYAELMNDYRLAKATASLRGPTNGNPTVDRATIEEQKEKRVLEVLGSVDKSAIPFGDDSNGSVRYSVAKPTYESDLEKTLNGSGERRFTVTGGAGGFGGIGGGDGTRHEAEAKNSGVVYKDGSVTYLEGQARGFRESQTASRAQLAEQVKLFRESLTALSETEGKSDGLSQTAVAERRQQALEKLKEIKELLEKRGDNFSVNTEAYAPVVDNPFLSVDKNPLSTFSTDVDTASYANVRRFLNQGTRPPRDAVRIEELINYFSYEYPQPQGNDPFSVNLEVAGCPWNADHRLVRIGLKGREITDQQRPPVNLVFLIDVSGSMQPDNKLPLLKSALRMLVQKLGENERVAIVTYANEIRLVLPSTTCDSKETIIQAIESLQAGGGTNGGGGIQLAYQVAIENFLERGVNRVILSTDGDFNIGITDRDELTRFIEEKAKSKVFLSVLGFGMGNLKDATLERLADKGNGHYAYIDTMDEARKVLGDQLNGTLVTIAKDVKLQIEFNPAQVSAYRLIGYENRVMAAQDFNDDRKDAGDIGAGHTVTALYEIVPAGQSPGLSGIDPLKYQPDTRATEPKRTVSDDGPATDSRRELLTAKLRYKLPEGTESRLVEKPLTDAGQRYSEASKDFRFAAAVAAFGMILRDSPHRGTATLSGVLELAEDGRGADREGYRAEFLKLVRMAQAVR